MQRSTWQADEKPLWQRPEQLVQPQVLQTILADAHPGWPEPLHVLRVEREPFTGGVSGAQLERVQAVVKNEGRPHRTVPLIFKKMAAGASWLMRTSGDVHCREVQLWRAGIIDELPWVLYSPILAAAYDAATGVGALLMTDVGNRLGTLEDCFRQVQPERMAHYLDHLAHLHAHFWQDTRLSDPRLGLASTEQALLLLSPAMISAQLAAGDAHPYLPLSQAGWAAFFEHGPTDALDRIQRVLAHPASFLASAAQAPATLVHGDVWPPNMGTLPGQRGLGSRRTGRRTILIDWALATFGPATYDPFWLLFAWKRAPVLRALAWYRGRLTGHLARRGIRLGVAEWLLLVDLGIVRTVLACGETMGQGICFARNAGSRARASASLVWWTRWAAGVIERRGWER